MNLNVIDRKEKGIKINQIPRLTWRWLRINHSELQSISTDYVKPYKKKFLRNVDQEGIEKLNRDNIEVFKMDRDISENMEKIISQELYTQVEKKANVNEVIRIKEGHKIEKPIIIELETDDYNHILINKITIISEKNSDCSVILKLKNHSEELSSFYNSIINIFAQEESNLQFSIIQDISQKSVGVNSIIVDAKKSSQVKITSFELGGKNVYTKIFSNLEDEASCDLGSIYLLGEEQQLDVNYIMNHQGAKSQSNIQAYGALGGKATKTFKGTLDFKRGAKKAKGTEEEYVMLLSPKAKNLSAPLLLCEEDDVEGQHAASAGKIDEEKLFYLMSRGLNENEAKIAIVNSLFNPIIDRIMDTEQKEEIIDIIQRKLSLI